MQKKHFWLSLFITMAIAFPVWHSVGQDTERGLVLHLTFEEKQPKDNSAEPANVSLKGGQLKLTKGKVGQAAEFDGSTYIEVADADKLDGMEALTIVAWIQPEFQGDGMGIASKRIGHQGEDAYNFFTWTGNKLDGRIDSSGDFWSNTVLEDGKWYHAAYVFDGKQGQQWMYVNGELDAEGAQAKPQVPERESSLWIGELNDGRGFVYKGLMDELGIWNRALSQDEIKQTMLGISAPVAPQMKLTTTWGDMKK